MVLGFVGWIAVLALIFLWMAVNIVNEYQRLVVFRFGRLVAARGPGLVFIIPVIERAVRMDLRVVTLDVPPQDVITRDNVSVKVNAVVYFRVIDPNKALVDVENYHVRHLAAFADHAAQRLRPGRARRAARRARSHQREDPDDPRHRHRSLGHQGDQGRGQADRPAAGDAAGDRRAGGGGARAARQGDQRRGRVPGGGEAGRGGGDPRREPAAITLRYLQTLREIATEKNSTTLFPVPIDLLKPFLPKPE